MPKNMREYELIRSKRKTLSLQITREGDLVVRAPQRIAQAQIAVFVEAHESWIEKHIDSIQKIAQQRQSFSFEDGQELYYFGEKLKICTDNYIKSIQIIENYIHISNNTEKSAREKAVIDFLSKQALSFTEKRVETFSQRMGVKPEAVTVTSAKTRWGSCSGKNRICFSYRLICLPTDLIDYVVVHELAHIIEHNHSDRFYAQIAQVLPDYKQRQSNLKAFSKFLPF